MGHGDHNRSFFSLVCRDYCDSKSLIIYIILNKLACVTHCARGATGDARATRAARARHRGWFLPPQSSRAVRARRGGRLLLLLFSRPVAGRRPRPRLAPSLRPPLRAERERGGRRVTRAQRARRACVAVGGSHRRSRAGLVFARQHDVGSRTHADHAGTYGPTQRLSPRQDEASAYSRNSFRMMAT